jgi:phosphate-selective porin OprO/OprP
MKLGYFREPFTMESLTPADALFFVERSVVQALSPGRNTGVGLSGMAIDQRLTWATGLYYPTDNVGDGGGDGDISVTARTTFLPWHEGDDRLLHTGIAYSRRGEDDIRIITSSEIQNAPDFIDTDGFPPIELSPHLILMDTADLYGVESALMLGSFCGQAEYVRMDVDAPGGTDPNLWGYYVSCAYLLTGEHRVYNYARGSIGEISSPSEAYSAGQGPGAVEVAARYAFLDADSQGIMFPGEMGVYTLGINWFLNPQLRISASLSRTNVEHEGSVNIFATRFAIRF